MQIFIHKNGQQLGPFDEPEIVEMVQSGELSENDLIFRQGDTQWSKIGSIYTHQNRQPEQILTNNQPSLTSEIEKINEALRFQLSGTMDARSLIRKLVGFQQWIVPIANTVESVLANEPIEFLILHGENVQEKSVNFFTDANALTVFEQRVGVGIVNAHLVLPGESIFSRDFSWLSFVNINPFSENATFFSGKNILALKNIANSLGIEKNLAELANGNQSENVIREIINFQSYFVAVNTTHESGEPQLVTITDIFDHKTFPVFTALDYFATFRAIYCQQHGLDQNSLQALAFDGRKLESIIVLEGFDKVVFNLFNAENIEFTGEFGNILMSN